MFDAQATVNVTLDNKDGNPAGLTIVTEPSEEDTATTITEPYITKKISKRYFLNVDQRINKEARDKHPEWQDLKKNVGLLIDGELKEKMTVEAQLIGLKIFDDGGNRWFRTSRRLERCGNMTIVSKLQQKSTEFYMGSLQKWMDMNMISKET